MQYTRVTDRRTDGIGVAYTTLSIASRGKKTRIKGLPYCEETMIVDRTMWIQSTGVTDGETDKITMIKTAQRIKRHAVKIALTT